MGRTKNRSPYYSPMPKLMGTILAVSLIGCMGFSMAYRAHPHGWLFSCAITCGMFAYHIAIRFLTPVLLKLIFHRQYDPTSGWFRQKPWEQKLYTRLKVKNWKARVMTYDPREFSLQLHTPEEIVINMCHAEAVHELIMALSFTSLLFAIPFGSFGVFLITAILAAMLDGTFVLLQRYNRPRMVRLAKKQKQRTA